MILKRYIGDGVYVEIERGMLKLSAERDGGMNIIYLEPEVMDQLVAYFEEAKVVAKSSLPEEWQSER